MTDEARYRLLIDAITDYAIYMLSPAGIVTSWNPGAQRFKGYTADEIIGQHFSRFYTQEERQAGMPELALETADREGRYEREAWRVRKDGSRFWAHVVIDAIRSSDGELVGFAKITRDLTERREAEEALRKSEEQFRLLVEGVIDYAIFMLDPTGRVASWNAGAQRIKGYSPHEIIGEHFSRFYTKEDREAGVPFEGLDTARREGRWESEGVRVRKDGSTFWAHVVIDAIRSPSGEVVGFAKVTRDVTERKHAQTELERAREALYQSQKMEAVGQLTGGIAHDFNNLLMVALSSLELLRKRLPYDPRYAPLVDNAMQALQRGSVLTEHMLTFARRQELKLAPTHVGALLRGMHGFLQRSIGPTVRIDTQVPADLPVTLTDTTQLETAVLNLALNARDAMAGSGIVVVSARTETAGSRQPTLQPGDYIVVSVSDAGEGMDTETLAKAREPFFTTKGVGKGTGLGLSMVDGLAVQSGGGLVIESSKGQGTTVEIWLPVTGPADPATAFSAANMEAASGPQLVVMLVDDDKLVLTNTVSLLEDLGHFVIPASSGPEALKAIEVHPNVDVVVTDYAMPQMTGTELARDIKRIRPEMPVILATGYADLSTSDAPTLPSLRKPYTQEQLQDAVMRAVENGPAATTKT